MSIYKAGCRSAEIKAYYALRLNGFDMQPHHHDRCEIMYVVSGGCTVVCGEAAVRLRERQMVLLDHDTPHCLHVQLGSPCSLLNLEFACTPGKAGVPFDELETSCADFKSLLRTQAPFLVLQDTSKAGYALKDLIAELESNREEPYLLRLLFHRMLVELARCYAGGGQSAGIVHLNRAVRFIQDNLYEPLHVAAVAGHVGVHHAYLQTLFSSRFGCGIVAYINGQRMENAAFLLRNSDESITDIAYHVGCNSRQHFGYLFQHHFHMSPRQFRQMEGQAAPADTGIAQLQANAAGRFEANELIRAVPVE